MKEKDRIFFLPLWRRVAVTAVCVIWFGLEVAFRRGDNLWIIITGAMTLYAIVTFFIKFDTTPPQTELSESDPNVPPAA